MGPGAATLVIVLSILYAPGYARVAFAATLAARNLDYVTAQEALGAKPARILMRTILPNIAPPLLVQFSLTVAAAMVLESGLVVSRPRRRAAVAVLGADDPRRALDDGAGAVAAAVAVHRAHRHHPRLQPLVRRAARRARSAFRRIQRRLV